MDTDEVVTPTTEEVVKPWLPTLFGKGWDVFNNRTHITLVNGSRLAGKTVACLDTLMRHLWEVPNAHVAMFSKSIKVAKEGGTWNLLVTDTLQSWCESNMATEDGTDRIRILTKDRSGIPGPKTDANTRTPYFEIRNKWGGVSTCKLYSVHDDNEIFSTCKNKFFTMVFFVEFTMFHDPDILPVTLLALRPTPNQVNGPLKDHVRFQWLADTNPCEKKGTDHWVYREFYTYRNDPHKAAEDTARVTHQKMTEELVAEKVDYYSHMRVIEMRHEENPHVTDKQRVILKNATAYDPLMFDSHYRGEWTDKGANKGKLFADIFSPMLHVIGNDEFPQISVNTNSYRLLTGWDLGSTNHAAVIVDKWIRKNKDTGREESCFSILDELVYINEEITLTEFTQEFIEKLDHIEQSEGKPYELQNWADDQALNLYRPNTGTYDYIEILAASDNRLTLEGVEKPANSVRTRIRFVRRLLAEERLFISWKCFRTIQMLEKIKEGGKAREPISRYGGHIHVFDAISYIIIKEMAFEFMDGNLIPQQRQATPKIISV